MRILPRTINWLDQLEVLSRQSSIAHHWDARLKILLCLIFQICVISFPAYSLSGLVPFLFFLVVVIRLSGISPLILLKGLLPILPFILLLGIMNPIFDEGRFYLTKHYSISLGWVSFFSIIFKSVLTISAGFLLIATTGFYAICQALKSMKVPQILVTQLLLTYRFLIELLHQANTYQIAFCQRRGIKKPSLREWGAITGHFFLSCMMKSNHIYQSIYARGGENPVFFDNNKINLSPVQAIFSLSFFVLMILCRVVNVPIWLEETFLN